jgi:hypothetical protein
MEFRMHTLSPRTRSMTPNLEPQKPVFEEIFDTYMLLGDRAYRKGSFDEAAKMYLAAWQEICHIF